jgi:hypothetical protein
MKTAEVFTHFTVTTLSSGSLTPLGCTTYIDDNPQLPLPSWVPDWTRTVDRIPFGMLEDVFSASRDSSPSLRVSPDYKVLAIKGKVACSIQRLGSMILRGHERLIRSENSQLQRDSIDWYWDWLSDMHAVAFGDDQIFSPAFFQSESYRLFCRALCCGIDQLDEHPPLKTSIDELSNMWQKLSNYRIPPPPRGLLGRIISSITPPLHFRAALSLFSLEQVLKHFVIVWSLYRRFCCTDTGFLGWVPDKSRVGDVVCVFYGSKVPHLLRPSTNGCYELIGECYMQGLMEGKVIDLQLEDNIFHIA